MAKTNFQSIDEYIRTFSKDVQIILQIVRQTIKKELSQYKHSKGSARFPLNKPMPLSLIEKIVKFRVKETLERKI